MPRKIPSPVAAQARVVTGEPLRRKPASERVPAAPRTPRERLCRDDWIAAGQAVLRAQGITAVKLATLTSRLGVSIGSFYHHFTNFEEYLGALAEHYSVERVREELARAQEGDPDPLTRIRRLGAISTQRGTFDLDLAMRVWATMDARAAQALQRAEELVLAFLAQAFGDLGFDAEGARLRARLLLAANVATLGGLDARGHARFLRESLTLLSARPVRRGASAGRRLRAEGGGR